MKRCRAVAFVSLIILIVIVFSYYTKNLTTTISKVIKVNLTEENFHDLRIMESGGEYKKDLKGEYVSSIVKYLGTLKLKEIPIDRKIRKTEVTSNIVEEYRPYHIIFMKENHIVN